MVARALWRSEALRVVPWLRPCTRLRLVQVSDQGTTLRASDLHNTRATILNPLNSRDLTILYFWTRGNLLTNLIFAITGNGGTQESDDLCGNLPDWYNPALIPKPSLTGIRPCCRNMMTSWHGIAVHITGPLWEESTRCRRCSLTKS